MGVCFSSVRVQSKVLRIRSDRRLDAITSLADGCQLLSASILQPSLRVGSSCNAVGMNIRSCGSLSNYKLVSCPTSIRKRSISHVSGALSPQNDAAYGKDEESSCNLKFKKYNYKSWKGKKAFGARREKVISNVSPERSSSILKASATRGPDMISSKNHIPLEEKKDAEVESPDCNGSQNSSMSSKPKKSRSKKSKSQASDTNADEAVELKHSVELKKQNVKDSNLSAAATQISSTKGTSTDTQKSNVSTKVNQSSKKGNPKKGVADVSVSDASLPDSSMDIPTERRMSQLFGRTTQENVKFPQLYPPIAKTVLVVESVTKAKVIQGYLGDMFEVLPSYGHVRDLAARSGSVRPDDDFSMVWEVPSAAWTHLKSIKVALSGAKNLVLASDPDREGEAIAWHIIEMLHQQDALRDDVTVARVVFNEITESSIKNALQSPRTIDVNLVHAYLARRALDYLIGFNISPLLWRKLPSCQSAGRVQSAALALICDREAEIHDFKPQEYWTVEAEFNKREPRSKNSIWFSSNLTEFDYKKLNQLSIGSSSEASSIKQLIDSSKFEVIASKKSKSRRNPPNPYITSTMQQDAANKLNFTAADTMKIAQKLYEGVQLSDGKAVGLITYMRTDGLHISDEAASDILSFVRERYGQTFAPKAARKYFKKVKNAQEAHEAIRPTDIRRLPSMLAGVLDGDSLKLYKLIWSRTVACQMEPAINELIQLDIGDVGRSMVLRSSCSRVEFPGFQSVFQDTESKLTGLDEDEMEGNAEIFEVLSSLEVGDSLDLGKVEIEQHHTKPPSRYSEGSLVKKLEELGIGRPSTYASTIKVLKDRNYVTVKGRVMYPEFRGRMVSAFLSHYFSEVTDYSFTADMETELDNVSAGSTEWKGLLRDYWTRFSEYCTQASNVHIHQVEKMLEKTFSNFLFASTPNGSRTCPSCSEGTLIFKVSRHGAGYFIGCDQHPRCKYIAKKLYGDEDDPSPEPSKSAEPPVELGHHPVSKEKVLLKDGPYGHYVQLGEDRQGYTPKRISLNKAQIKDLNSVTLEVALELLSYPKTLGKHSQDDKPVILTPGKGGFYIKHGRFSVPLPKNMKPEDVDFDKAKELLRGPGVTKKGRPSAKEQLEKSMSGTS
ncbi:OLC1v1025509C1 [Oldenlandia corymbosa var. corymbosa]|uniref:DNA topoisomerase n=1 Tax=Oldenlandia corymbosa var. corymbosa TaxID=529605 RepID=A0AAV1C7C3_OLDCO|nr:OLC1v1025509C1 [Oldenlandia corymbosa var. corymbosa]